MSNDEHKQRPRSRKELAGWYAAALEDQASSGLSVAAYASEIGVTAATLYQWKRRLGGRKAKSDDRAYADGSSGLIRVALEPGRSARTPERFLVRLSPGRSIEVPQDFAPAALEQLLGILGAC